MHYCRASLAFAINILTTRLLPIQPPPFLQSAESLLDRFRPATEREDERTARSAVAEFEELNLSLLHNMVFAGFLARFWAFGQIRRLLAKCRLLSQTAASWGDILRYNE